MLQTRKIARSQQERWFNDSVSLDNEAKTSLQIPKNPQTRDIGTQAGPFENPFEDPS